MSDVILQGVVAKPGDTLVLAYQRAMSQDEMARFKASIKERLPQVEILILSRVDSLTVVRAPEEAA